MKTVSHIDGGTRIHLQRQPGAEPLIDTLCFQQAH